MAWPSTLTSFTDPLSSERLNSPSHSGIETAQNTGLEEIQKYIGVNTGVNASTVGTLLYDIKSPLSNGGGHVQTVNKGGTGQTSYTKGDVLIASDSSTLTKLAVGVDNQILVANSSTATGINWATDTNNKLSTSASVITVTENTASSVYSVTVPGSVLGLSNALRATVPITQWSFPSQNSVIAVARYGGIVGSVMLSSSGGSIVGEFVHTIIANANVSAQRHVIEVKGAIMSDDYRPNEIFVVNAFHLASVFGFHATATSTSSVNSTGPATMGMEIRLKGSDGVLTTAGHIVEKING